MALTVQSNDPAAVETTRAGEKFSDARGFLGSIERGSDGVTTYLALKTTDGTIRYITVATNNTISASATRP